MTRPCLVVLAVLIAPPAFAQTADATIAPQAQPRATAAPAAGLSTPTGSALSVSLGSYRYVEPGSPGISIHGAKIGAEYSNTRALARHPRWFVQADARGRFGNVTYDGACSPWVIKPDSASPNGYELDLGDFSPCGESGDVDWYVEGRGVIGKDFIGQRWAWSPSTGVGIRRLSNGTGGISDYRTDTYLYVPVGLTARTRVATRRPVSFNVEYDRLIHGWQKTRDSAFGGGDVPATPTAPAFTIDGFSDVAFSQHEGWALRAGARYQLAARWFLEPQYVHWKVAGSTPNDETATFTVHNITAQEHLGFYEPLNHTNEFEVQLGFAF
jgi:hypothetical protein